MGRMNLFYLFSLLLCSNFVPSLGSCTTKYVLIRNPTSGLVLDGRYHNRLTIQVATNSDEQLWEVRPSCKTGLFNIINKSNGMAIDIDKIKRTYDGEDVPHIHPILTEFEDSSYQQWFINSEGTIINGALTGYTLDIAFHRFKVGNTIIMWNRYHYDKIHGIDGDSIDNEQFEFVPVPSKTESKGRKTEESKMKENEIMYDVSMI